ncbi:MAG: hypothetical protein AAGJ83_11415, partial [Planctomycetota bacterium]
PAHLLTREAMQLYRTRLAAGGVLAIHTSNNHLELSPLVHRLSDDAGFESRMIEGVGDDAIGTTHSTWMIVAQSGHSVFQIDPISQAKPPSRQELRNAPLWTDQHHNLVGVLRLWQH